MLIELKQILVYTARTSVTLFTGNAVSSHVDLTSLAEIVVEEIVPSFGVEGAFSLLFQRYEPNIMQEY